MQPEQTETLLTCKYCEAPLRRIEPLVIIEADSETTAITRTLVCDNCGANVTNRKSPASGDCLLEIPREYEFALQRFSERIGLLADFDDHEPPAFEACTLKENAEFHEILNHDKHGDGFTISVCTCCTAKIHFDGHITLTVQEERGTPWDHDPIRHFSEQNQAFEDLRHKLDDLLFDSAQLREVQTLIAEYLATGRHMSFCSRGERFDRLSYWAMAGAMEYPDRYTAFGKADPQE